MSQSSDPSARRAHTRRAVSASTIGAIIEGYDLIIFGTYAALIFPKLFFPNSDPATGILLSFGTYFIGFVARPLGGVIFGHLGDRLGRKPIMIVTLTMVGIGTFGAGLLPTYAQVGVISAYLLVLSRIIQGLGFGGEWGGGTLLAMESGSSRRAALLASFPQAGAPLGLSLANIAVLVVTVSMPPAILYDWGWRIPLLITGVLFVVGFYLRTRVEETPVFQAVQASGQVVRRPIVEVFLQQKRTLLLTVLVKAGSGISVFVFSAFVLSYGVTKGYTSASLILGIVIAGLLCAVLTPVAGLIADRVGAARVWQFGAAAMIVFGYLFFAAVDARLSWAPVFLVFSLVPYAFMFGPEASMISKSFSPQWRYSGSSLAFNLGGILGGGLAPLLSQVLVVRFDSGMVIASYIALGCLLGGVSAQFLRRSTRVESSRSTLVNETAVSL